MRDVEEPPDTRRLYTPMLAAGCGVRLALFRDRHGEACAVGFSSAEALERVLGTTRYEAWPLGRSVVRELAEVRGVRRVLVDPVFAAAVVSDGELEQASTAAPATAATPTVAPATPAPATAAPAVAATPATATAPVATPAVAATAATPAAHAPRRMDPQVAGALAVCAVAGAAAVFLGELR